MVTFDKSHERPSPPWKRRICLLQPPQVPTEWRKSQVIQILILNYNSEDSAHRADVLCYLLRVAGMINLPQENQKAASILGET